MTILEKNIFIIFFPKYRYKQSTEKAVACDIK